MEACFKELTHIAEDLHAVLEVGIKTSVTDLPMTPSYTTNINPIIHSLYYTPSSHHITTKLRNINLMSIGSGVCHLLRPD